VEPTTADGTRSITGGDGGHVGSVEARTFVLVPGMGATAAMWTPLVRELALRGARSVPVELPGHGFDTRFPEGYSCPQDLDRFAAARSPIAGIGLDDYVAHVLALVRGAATVGPVVLVGHSLGGNVVTRIGNEAPDLLDRMVYVCAYCCVEADTVLDYVPWDLDSQSPLARARRLTGVGDPRMTGASRSNLRSAEPEVLEVQHALMMSDLDRDRVPAVLAYGLQPDEPVAALAGHARIDPESWGTVPRTYIRTLRDEVLPPRLQDRMIREADTATPGRTFTVAEIDASHLVPLSRPADLADLILAEV
jgi:pimeloyl-ACP methyl ester carboxylesterase